MRLFQNCGYYAPYAQRLRTLHGPGATWSQQLSTFFADHYSASHILKPVLDGDPDAFFANANDASQQAAWARENGLAATASPEEILSAQIEHHRAEVFYNLDPVGFGSDFVRRLPSSVKAAICWRAAPSGGADFSAYARVLCNYPSVIEQYRAAGMRAVYFSPAHDPALEHYAGSASRSVDVLFVGTYSRHHVTRAPILEAVARLADTFRIEYALEVSRFTRLAETPLGYLLPRSGRYRRPQAIRRVTRPPLYGADYYRKLGDARIVLNGAIDMSGEDKGNMRCWEALGARSLMITDKGAYPAGFVDGENMLTYRSADEAVSLVRRYLSDDAARDRIANTGHEMIRTRYGKQAQWDAFRAIAADIA